MEQDFIQYVGKILHGYNMVVPGMHLGVAVSGGADSVALLHVLNSLAEGLDLRLTVLHFNHQLRGVASEEDKELVGRIAASLALPIISGTHPSGPGNLEQEARRDRHRFFQQWRRQFEGARVALGHTRTDQSETVLFRFLRGTGLTGLAGMTPLTPSGLVRPFLFLSRQEVRSFAEKSGLVWREDLSNQDQRFRRNRLRLVTIPQLRSDYNPALEETLARSAAIAGEEEHFWETRTRRQYRRLVSETPLGLIIQVNELRKLHVAEQRRLLRRSLLALRKTLRSIDSSHINSILKICAGHEGHDRVIIPGVDAIRSFQTLLLAEPEIMRRPRSYVLDVTPNRPLNLPFQLGEIVVSTVNTERQNCVTVKDAGGDLSAERFVDGRTIGSQGGGKALQVRNWEPGDTIQPQGASRPEKIKTLFQENRVVLWERRHWPVLVVGGQVVWARRFGIDTRFLPRAAAVGNLLEVRFFPVVVPPASASESKHRNATSL